MSKSGTFNYSLTDSLFQSDPVGSSTSSSSVAYAADYTVVGGVNAFHRAQMSAGTQAGTDLDVTVHGLDVKPGRCYVAARKTTNPFQGMFIQDWTGVLSSASYPVASADPNAEASAVRALYSKIRGAHQQFAGGVFLGELKETARLISHPTQLLLGSARTFVKGWRKTLAGHNLHGKIPKSLKQALSNDYLAWTYGAQPLLADIKDATLAFRRIISDPPMERFTARGVSESSVFATHGDLGRGNFNCKRTSLTVTTTSIKYYGAFKAMERSSDLLSQASRVADLSGFSLAQFVPTVWNLIPYSFLVDYVVNVGDMLEAAFTDTSGVAWLSRTQVVEAVNHFTATMDKDYTLSIYPASDYVIEALSNSPGGFTATTRTIHRSSSLVPILEPRLNLGFSTGRHLLNSLALLLGR